MELKTKLVFPIEKYDTEVTYTKVENMSGFAKILLILISNSTYFQKDYKEEIYEIVNNRRLNHIFDSELEELSRKGLIKSNYQEPEYFSDFTLTKDGEKAYRENLIATGEEMKGRLDFYYDVALKELSLNVSDTLKYEFNYQNDVDLKEEMLDKLNRLKGQKIGKQGEKFQIKQEEDIKDLTYNKKCILAKGVNFTFRINNKELDLITENNKYKAFLDKEGVYHLQELINSSEDFQVFNSEIKQNELIEIKTQKIYNLNDYQKIEKKNKDLVISEDANDLKNDLHFNDPNLVRFLKQEINNNIRSLIVSNGSVKAYINNLTSLKWHNEDILLPHIIEVDIEKEKLEKIVSFILENKNLTIKEERKVIFEIAKIVENYSYVKDKLETLVSNNNTDRAIELMYDLYSEFKSNENLKNIWQEKGRLLLKTKINSLNDQNIDGTLNLIKNLRNYLNISENSLLKEIETRVDFNKNKLTMYENLSHHFKEENIIIYLNPFKEAQAEERENETLKTIYQLNKNIVALITKEYLKKDYDDLNKKEFKSEIININDQLRKLELFKEDPLYKQLKSVAEGYRHLLTYINEDEASNKDIKKFKKEEAKRLLEHGNYFELLRKLAVKLESLIKTNKDCTLYEAIEKANLDKEKKDILHKLRIERNEKVAHYNTEKVKFSEATLKEYIDAVFSLEEEKDK